MWFGFGFVLSRWGFLAESVRKKVLSFTLKMPFHIADLAQARPGETPAETASAAVQVTVKQTPPCVSRMKVYQQHKFLANIKL